MDLSGKKWSNFQCSPADSDSELPFLEIIHVWEGRNANQSPGSQAALPPSLPPEISVCFSSGVSTKWLNEPGIQNREADQHRVKLMPAYLYFHLSKFVLCWFVSNASMLSIRVSSFFAPKAKAVRSNNKREEKYEKISLIKGLSCHSSRLIFLSPACRAPSRGREAAAVPFHVSPCLACVPFDYDSSPFNSAQTGLRHVPGAGWPVRDEGIGGWLVLVLSLRVGVSGRDIRSLSAVLLRAAEAPKKNVHIERQTSARLDVSLVCTSSES